MKELPHSQEAEESVIGAMLLNHLAIDAVSESLIASDFYVPAHCIIFDTMVKMRSVGQSVDAVTVLDAIKGAGLVDAIGDPVRLVEMQSRVPSVANVSHYAQIVMDNSLRRRLIVEARALEDQAFDAGVDANDALDAHRTTLTTLGSSIISREPNDVALEDFLQRPRETISPWVVPKIIRRRHKVILVGNEGSGKALAVDTPILTTNGWSTMGSLIPGDHVFGPDGQPTVVVAVTEPFEGECHRLVFSDGASVIADANHLWQTETLKSREKTAAQLRRTTQRVTDWRDQRWKRVEVPSIKTTREIFETLMARGGHALNHSVGVCQPLQMPAADLPISPYTFGAWLGDGTGTAAVVTSADQEILDEIQSEGWRVSKESGAEYGWRVSGGKVRDGFESRCRRLGVWGNKHIPDVYKMASHDQRLALLQGLMDTDGTVSNHGAGSGRGSGASRCEFSVVDKRLAYDVLELLLGLGIKVTMREGAAKINGRYISQRYRLGFQTNLPVFRLPRKAERLIPLRTKRACLRYIQSCEPIGNGLVRCIQVDRSDGMFLCGRELIPTHNSWILRYVAICAAYGIRPFRHTTTTPIRTLIVDLENPEDALYDSFEPMVKKATTFNPQSETVNRLWWRPEGINLRNRVDLAEFENVIRVRRPDLVCLGPLYAAYENSSKDFGWETAAREVQGILKRLMVRYDFALLIEDHAPQGDSQGKRQMRPYGSSFWRRWPDIGIGMEPLENADDAFRLTRWRGDRVPTDWPTIIERGSRTGSPWPFLGRWEGRNDRF